MTVHAFLLCAEYYPERGAADRHLPGSLREALGLARWLHRVSPNPRITVLASVCLESATVADELLPLIDDTTSILAGPGRKNTQLTATHVEYAIRDADLGWRDGDRVLLHWSGHGTLSAKGRLLELPAFTPEGRSEALRYAIETEELLRRFRHVGERSIQQVAVFETCAEVRPYTNATVLNVNPHNDVVDSPHAAQCVVDAAGDGQLASRLGERAHFTGSLIPLLADHTADALTCDAFAEIFLDIHHDLSELLCNGGAIVGLPRYRPAGTTGWTEPRYSPDRAFGYQGRRLLELLGNLPATPADLAAMRVYLIEHGLREELFASEDPVAWGRGILGRTFTHDRDHPVRFLLQWLHARFDRPQILRWAAVWQDRKLIRDLALDDVDRDHPMTLLMRVREDPDSPEDEENVRYDAMSVVYIGDEPHPLPGEAPAGTGLAPGALNRYLADFFRRTRSGFSSLRRAQIHIVVPPLLLNHPFECTPIVPSGRRTNPALAPQLGSLHPVMLRPESRHGVDAADDHEAWTRLADAIGSPARDRIHWSPCDAQSTPARAPAATTAAFTDVGAPASVGFVQGRAMRPGTDAGDAVERALMAGEWAFAWADFGGCAGRCFLSPGERGAEPGSIGAPNALDNAGGGAAGANGACAGSLLGERLHATLTQQNRTVSEIPSVVYDLRRTLRPAAPSGGRIVLVFDDPNHRPWQHNGPLEDIAPWGG